MNSRRSSPSDGKVKRTNQYEPGMKTWLYHQQRCFREGKLSKDKIQALRDVGVTLKMTQRVSWDARLMELIEFKRIQRSLQRPCHMATQ